jgi:hypothetical protein
MNICRSKRGALLAPLFVGLALVPTASTPSRAVPRSNALRCAQQEIATSARYRPHTLGAKVK